jgi:hypothetical protein
MCSVFFFCVLKTREKRWYDKKCGNSHVRSVFSRAYVTCEKRHPIWIFSPMRKSCRAQKVLTLLFFFSFETHNATRHRTEKRNTNEKKKRHFIFAARALVVAKEKRDERDARKSSFSSYSSPFTVLARCHASFRHGFFERVSERNFKSSRVSNVSVRFICLSSSPFLVLRASSCARDVLFLRAFSLSLSLKTETKDAL